MDRTWFRFSFSVKLERNSHLRGHEIFLFYFMWFLLSRALLLGYFLDFILCYSDFVTFMELFCVMLCGKLTDLDYLGLSVLPQARPLTFLALFSLTDLHPVKRWRKFSPSVCLLLELMLDESCSWFFLAFKHDLPAFSQDKAADLICSLLFLAKRLLITAVMMRLE